MEIAECVSIYVGPVAAFLDPDNCQFFRDCQAEYDSQSNRADSSMAERDAVLKSLDNNIELDIPVHPQWRIDGTWAFRQFYAIPSFMLPNLDVKRIDVFIPCQSKHPTVLRHRLKSSAMVNLTGNAILSLGISHYVLKALQTWSTSQPQFTEIFQAMPFGSRIVMKNIPQNPEDAKFHWLPNGDFMNNLLSIEELHQLWNLKQEVWPSIIELARLQHHKQLHSSTSLVRIPSVDSSKIFIFKTSLRRMKYIYHELKLLLTMDSDPAINPRPIYLVTEGDPCGGGAKVIGMIMKYFDGGTLKEALDSEAHIPIQTKLRWADQVLQGLQRISKGPAGFYSEIKPDNLLFTRPMGDIVFIDFEQSGNWITFLAPEIYFVEYLEKLSNLEVVPKEKRAYYADLLRNIVPSPSDKQELYSNPSKGYYDAWTSLTHTQQEAAMVYAFGKLLWCIFEETSHTRNNFEENYHVETNVEFPNFQQTPPLVQELIKHCTRGSPDWIGGARRIRKGSTYFHPEGMSGQNGEPMSSPREAMECAKQLAIDTIQKMEAYIEAKIRIINGVADTLDEELLGFPLRPSFSFVKDFLNKINKVYIARYKGKA
jgi:hypothetical protein